MDWNQLALAALTAAVAAGWRYARAWAQTKVTPDKLAHVADIANGAVRAAEEIGRHFVGENPQAWTQFTTWGEAKASYASGIITAAGRRFGLRLSSDEVNAFLHAALRRLEDLAPADVEPF